MNDRWRSKRTTPLLWEFLLSLLQDKECQQIIKWTNESKMEFMIADSNEVSMLWGVAKGRPKMDQNKLRRAIRQYYKSGVMKKVKGKKGGYKFENLPYNPFTDEGNNVTQESMNEKSSNVKEEKGRCNYEQLSNDQFKIEENVFNLEQVSVKCSDVEMTDRYLVDISQNCSEEPQITRIFRHDNNNEGEGENVPDEIIFQEFLERNFNTVKLLSSTES